VRAAIIFQSPRLESAKRESKIYYAPLRTYFPKKRERERERDLARATYVRPRFTASRRPSVTALSNGFSSGKSCSADLTFSLSLSLSPFVYKMLNGTSSLSLRNKIEIVGSESHMCTRQAGTIVLGFRKTRNAQRSVFYERTKLFNSLPPRIRGCGRLEVFRRELNTM